MNEPEILIAKPFIQILDESMCVVREDINDWLQRYLFNSENVSPINPEFLLYRLSSGIWLARLAYKLHHTVFAQSENSVSITSTFGALRGRPLTKKSREFRFSSNLLALAKRSLGELEKENYSEDYIISEASSFSSVNDLDCSRCKICTFGNGVFSSSEKCSHTTSKSSMSESQQSKSFSKISASKNWEFRSNVTAFLEWCKDLGIKETVLFETNGLIHRTEEKNVLLTLMEITRLASYYGLTDLPELVRMEREIEALEEREAMSHEGCDEPRLQILSTANHDCFNMTNSSSSIASLSSLPNEINNNNLHSHEILIKKLNNELIDDNLDATQGRYNDLKSKKNSFLNEDSNKLPKETFTSDIYLKISDKFDQESKTSASSSGVGGSSDEESLHSDLLTGQHFRSKIEAPELPHSDIDIPLKKGFCLSNESGSGINVVNRKISVNNDQTAYSDASVEAKSKGINKSTNLKIPNNYIEKDKKSYVNKGTFCSKNNTPDRLPPTKIPLPTLTSGQKQSTPSSTLCKSSSRDSLFVKPSIVSIPRKISTCSTSSRPTTPNSELNSKKFKDNDVYNMVFKKIFSCACHDKINFQRLDEGRYRLGNRVYYLRKFRSHIMVRVGGGWLTLDEFLARNDPCRKQGSRLVRTNSYSEAYSNARSLTKDNIKIEWNKADVKQTHHCDPSDCSNFMNSSNRTTPRLIKDGVLLRSNQ